MEKTNNIYTVWHNGQKITELTNYSEIYQRGLGIALFLGISEEWKNTLGTDVLDRWETPQEILCITKHPEGQGVEYTSVEIIGEDGDVKGEVPALDYVGSGKIKVAIDWPSKKYVHQSVTNF